MTDKPIPAEGEITRLVNHHFPGGFYTVAHWENFLLTECTGAALLPVRWTPVPRVLTDELQGRPLAVSPGRPAPDPSATEAEAEQPDSLSTTPPDVPVGYYAIVGSARQRDGIDALVQDLGAAGFPVQVQSITDLAGENWFRGLVGPFATRAEADAAARQLQRERQLQSWVTGIDADS